MNCSVMGCSLCPHVLFLEAQSHIMFLSALAGTGLQTLTAIVPALIGCPEHSTLGHASSRLPRAFNFRARV